jgi:hypothetical protein
MSPAKPMLELELRPVEAPSHATPGARVFVLLPRLDELLGEPGFGSAQPIVLPGALRPFVPSAFFAPYAARRHLH